MIDIGHGRSINKEAVMSCRTDTRYYVNDSVTSLEIVMIDGTRYTVKHEPQYLGGVNVYDLWEKLK